MNILITVQNKIFESLASKKTIVTEKTSSIQELLEDRQGVLFCHKANPESLAQKIVYLKNNPLVNQEIAQAGYNLFQQKLMAKTGLIAIISANNFIFSSISK